MTTTSSYDAILFRQRPESPLQVAFVASSAEIDSWARVPTKRTGNIRNFQRAEIERHVKEVTRFFEDRENASPTAIVVGFDPIRSQDRIGLEIAGKRVTANEVAPGTPVLGRIAISWQESDDPSAAEDLRKSILARRERLTAYLFAELREITGASNEAIELLSREFDQRALDGKPRLSDALDTSDGSGAGDEDATDEYSSDEGAEASVDDLSPEASDVLQGLTPSERQILIGRMEFIANVQATLVTALGQDALVELHREIEDELKPGLLIDGQHRVMGTKLLPDIPFLVCAMPEAAWPELAFQFIVTNRTARRVQESLLINIVGNSLSKPQRAQIESRLRDAGIRVGLIEAIMKVNEDELSPFFNLLAFGIKNEKGFLDAAAMRNKVVQLWYERKNPVRDLFDHFAQGKSSRDRTDYWKSEQLWFEYFVAFWSAVRDRYEGSDVFSVELINGEPVSKLMSATVLKIFQETVLNNLHAYLNDKLTKEEVPIKQSIKNEKSFTNLVTKALKPLTPAFFEGWQITGFDGSKGAKLDLEEAILKVLNNEKTVAELKNPKSPHRLFKEFKGD